MSCARVGQPAAAGGILSHGYVHLLSDPSASGSAGQLAHVSLVGAAPDDRAGASLATADLDGDGRWDLLVGAPQSAAGGRAYLAFGGSDAGARGLGTDALRILGAGPDDLTGYALAAGDLDGDGLGDAVVGAPLFSGDAALSGRRVEVDVADAQDGRAPGQRGDG